jgi:hypothetical protein
MNGSLPVRAASAAAALVVACLAAAQPAPPAVTYVGVVPAEPPARVAVVVEGDAFLAYVCGKTDDFNQAAAAWFKGTVRGGAIESEVDGKRLSAVVEGGTVRGTVEAGGRARSFTAAPVSGVAGLYRAARGDRVFGWVVDAKHQVVGGCHAKSRPPVALTIARPLTPPAAKQPGVKVAVKQPPPAKAEIAELLVEQVDEEPGVAVQGERVESAVNPPAGRVVPVPKK